MATKTETQINELKINYLTEAQYEEALANNEINDNEIYMTPSDDKNSGEDDSSMAYEDVTFTAGTGVTIVNNYSKYYPSLNMVFVNAIVKTNGVDASTSLQLLTIDNSKYNVAYDAVHMNGDYLRTDTGSDGAPYMIGKVRLFALNNGINIWTYDSVLANASIYISGWYQCN